VVPRLGTACQVRLLSQEGAGLQPVASAPTDAQAPEGLQRLAAMPQRGNEEPAAAQLLVLPLRARQRPLGTLCVYREPDSPPFEGTERLLLQELADRAGLALEVARACEAERRARHAAEVAAERLARLQRVTGALSEAVTPADVARIVVEEMMAAIGADRAAAVAPLADTPELLEVVGHRGPRAHTPSRFPAHSPLPVAVAYRSGEPVWLESREALASAFPESVVAEPEGTRAMAALPLLARGRTLGAIAFGFDSPRTFGPDERGLLVDLARQSALALERAHLYEAAQQARTRAERAAARTARLQTLNAALSQVLTSSRVAEVVIDQGVAAVGAQLACLWLTDESVAQARLLRSVGLPPEVTGPLGSLPLEPGMLLEDALRQGQPVWLESGEELARHYPQTAHRVGTLLPSSPPFSMACLPLRVDGRGLGALVFGFAGVHRFDDDERVFLSLLAHHAAQALERARLFAQERSAREALREAHHTLEAIIQSSPTVIVLMEMDGTVRLWNPAAERIFGWRAEEVLGRFIPVVPEDKREEFRGNMARLARGESILGMETRRQRRDGTPLHVSMWASTVRVAGDRRLCVAVLTDTTERKRAEEALRFLAEASSVLASSLEHEVTLERVAHLAVPTYADGC
ncbi:MAG: GAF domain-containing protein, partial [Archangium sp.]